ncbi:MAG TPA: amino acid adenylation domain-containing protein [Puia sp.]|nr:amino acid adenylation domain-containing protein [Puia sp.]
MNLIDLVKYKGEKYLPHAEFWQERRKRFEEGFSFRQRTDASGEQGCQPFEFMIQSQNEKNMREIAGNESSGLFICLIAGIMMLLRKYNRSQEVILHTPYFKAPGQGPGDQFIPLALTVNDEHGLKEFLSTVQQTVKTSYQYQDYPIRLSKDGQREAVLNSNILVLFGDIHELPKKDPDYELIIRINRDLDGIQISINYQSNWFTPAFIERIPGHLGRFLDYLGSNVIVKEIDILTPQESEALLIRSGRKKDPAGTSFTIHELFEAQVFRTPFENAVECGPVSLTYTALNEKVNKVAHFLKRSYPDGQDRLVALMMDNSELMIIAMLAVLKAGAPYVPLDPSLPKERLKFILEDTSPVVLITQIDFLTDIAFFEGGIIALDIQLDLLEESSENIPVSCSPESLAYIIYTSGSTGKPKGVMMEHRALATLIMDTDYCNPGPGDRSLQLFNYAFDPSVFVIFSTLLNGACLYIIPKEILFSHRLLVNFMTENRINLCVMPTALFNNLMEISPHCISNLDKVYFGGEKASVPNVRKALEYRKRTDAIVNLYGPTEACIIATYYTIEQLPPNSREIPIGKPVSYADIYILDANLNLMPDGITGEIYIGGGGLARGYLHRQDLTGSCFPESPFKKGERIYRTGDLGYWLPDDTLQFTGRNDHQVKIRGFRIEPAEIAEVLKQMDEVEEACVLANETSNGEKCLTAYLIPSIDNAYTIRRLAELNVTYPGLARRLYELPNGMVIDHKNKTETDFIYNEVFKEHIYLKHGIRIDKGDTVFDVGANIGLFSLYASLCCPGINIFAFEPVQPVYESLVINTSLYPVNVKAFPIGLSDRYEMTEFDYYPGLTALSGKKKGSLDEKDTIRKYILNQLTAEEDRLSDQQLTEVLNERMISEKQPVRLYRLSDIIRENKIDSIHLLKIDVEKSEYEVLCGIEDQDWDKIGQVVMEIHDEDQALQKIEALLKAKGFFIYFEQDLLLRETNLFNLYASRKRLRVDGFPEERSPAEEKTRYTSMKSFTDHIRKICSNILPDHMIPSDFIVLDKFPLTSNGKTDYKALKDIPVLGQDVPESILPRNQVEKQLLTVWKEVLKVDAVGLHSNFFEAGGNSLSAIRLVSRLQEYFKVSINNIFMFPTVASLSDHIEYEKDYLKKRLQSFINPEPEAPSDSGNSLRQKEEEEYLTKIRLSENSDTGKQRSYSNILLTGATGYLGAHVLSQLLTGFPSIHVFVIVRAGNNKDAMERLTAKLKYYFGNDLYSAALNRITILAADLADERFGLKPADYAYLETTIDAVINCAANVRHYGSKYDFQRDNIDTVTSLIGFSTGGKPKDFHHVSTLSIATGRLKDRENVFFTEFDCDKGQVIDNLYSWSKLEAEKKILAAGEMGLSFNIYRVSNLSFDSITGVFQENIDTNAFYARMRSFIELGYIPAFEKQWEFSPVDQVAKAILSLFDKPYLTGTTHHIHNPYGLSTRTFAEYTEKAGLGLSIMDTRDFIQYILDNYENHRQTIDRLLLHYSMFEEEDARMTQYDMGSERTMQLLNKYGFHWTEISEEQVQLMLEHCKAVNYLSFS